MPTVRMTITGSETLRRNLARLAGNERRQAQRDGLEAGARVYEAEVKLLLSQPGSGETYTRNGVSHTASAPGEPPAVDTDFLRNSIQVDEVTPNEAIIAPHTDYAEHLEFGTSRMAARPYMRPALDEHEREIVDAIERTVAAFVESVRA